jgi:hypothetical protein
MREPRIAHPPLTDARLAQSYSDAGPRAASRGRATRSRQMRHTERGCPSQRRPAHTRRHLVAEVVSLSRGHRLVLKPRVARDVPTFATWRVLTPSRFAVLDAVFFASSARAQQSALAHAPTREPVEHSCGPLGDRPSRTSRPCRPHGTGEHDVRIRPLGPENVVEVAVRIPVSSTHCAAPAPSDDVGRSCHDNPVSAVATTSIPIFHPRIRAHRPFVSRGTNDRRDQSTKRDQLRR